MNLSLKKMQDSGLAAMFSEKEIQKQLAEKLAEQQAILNRPKTVAKMSLEDVLAKGGAYSYRFEGKSYALSVLTPSDMNLMDNIDNLEAQGVSYDLPKMHKFHIKTAFGNTLFIKAKLHKTAQDICDAIFGKGRYSISSSRV